MATKKNNFPIPIKVVLIGDSGVGKTSIMQRFIKDTWEPQSIVTTAATYSSKEIEIVEEDNQKISLELWDTAGQEKYRALTKIFYKNAACCILVYDITKKQTFDSLVDYWIKEISENSQKDTILAIVGNKVDCYENEQVDENVAKQFAKKNNAIFKSTSAKNAVGINDLFYMIGRKYIDPEYEVNEANPTDDSKEAKNERLEMLRGMVNKGNEQKLEKDKPKNDNKKCCK